jgi:GntR family transcriptional regulator, transcriptional repressor for pyruvate dehydrogenase complex
MRSAKQSRLSEEVMVRLADLIRKGSLKPGDRLPAERGLAEQMKVSRATLREALRVMQLRGLVVSRQGAGNYIASGPAEDLALALDHLALQDIFELRLLIEPSVAALAAQRASTNDISNLEAILLKQEDQVAHNKSMADSDAAFHSTLAGSTHNRALVEIGATLMRVSAPSRNKYLQTSQRARSSINSHRAILEAVKARDGVRARNVMNEHIHSIDRALFGLPRESVDVSILKIPSPEEVTL